MKTRINALLRSSSGKQPASCRTTTPVPRLCGHDEPMALRRDRNWAKPGRCRSLWLAAASVIAFTAPMMARLVAARRSTERCTDSVLPPMAALPLCFAGAILTGYLFEMSIRPFDLATSQFGKTASSRQ